MERDLTATISRVRRLIGNMRKFAADADVSPRNLSVNVPADVLEELCAAAERKAADVSPDDKFVACDGA